MTEKTNPCPCGGYKPTRREFFTALALHHVVAWANMSDLPETTDLRRAIAVAAVNFADKLIKALDENNETN
jgi:hypothetical protein